MEPSKKLKVLAAALPAAMAVLEDDEEDLCYSTDSDSEWYALPVPPRELPKSREYFTTIGRMDREEFLSHFRMTQGNFLL